MIRAAVPGGGSARTLLVVGLALAAACTPIEGNPRTMGPANACPCDGYPRDARNIAPRCDGGVDSQPARGARCVYGAFGGDPGYDFTIVVHVPTTSFFAPGATFLITKSELTKPTTPQGVGCKAPGCVTLRQLVEVQGTYPVEPDTFEALQAPFKATSTFSVPVRVTFFPRIGTAEQAVDARDVGLPLDPLLASSIRVSDENGAQVRYSRALSTGTYSRYSYPQPPYDVLVPPAVLESFRVGNASTDSKPLKKTDLDTAVDPEARKAEIVREDGLDGFRAWLAEAATDRRVSVIGELTGTKATTNLYTAGLTGQLTLGELALVVAPPLGAIGLPTLRVPLLGGEGIGKNPTPQLYPRLPFARSIAGTVGATEEGRVRGIASKVFLKSISLRQLDGKESGGNLAYESTVSTDDAGGFSVVLPAGRYDAFVEPAENTGYSKFRQTVEVEGAAVNLSTSSKRTVATGHIELGDGRPLAEAEVYFVPSKAYGAPSPDRNLDGRQRDHAKAPRPMRVRTDVRGDFRAEVDQGNYQVWIEPQGGSGFPRVVTLRPITQPTVDLGRIEVPLPTRIRFDIKDPRSSVAIGLALVRVYARPICSSNTEPCPLVEVASTMTNEKGQCEILLAGEPR